VWQELHQAHEAARALPGPKSLGNEVRRKLHLLAQKGLCSASAPSWVTERTWGDRRFFELRGSQSIELGSVEPLIEAKLSLSALTSRRGERIEKFTIKLEAISRPARPFVVSVELTEKADGQGACGHALLHCHIGPDHEVKPQIRVPLPALKPWDALDWVLSQIIPEWEPAPWQTISGGQHG
jgi:hypothetical protein